MLFPTDGYLEARWLKNIESAPKIFCLHFQNILLACKSFKKLEFHFV